MNRFTKFLICLVSLVGIIQSGWLLGIVIPIDHVSRVLLPSVQTQATWIWVLGIVISLIVTLVGIVGIAIAIFAPRKADRLRFNSPNGKLSISKPAVEKILRNAIMEQGNVNDVTVKLKLRTKNRVATVHVTAVDKLNHDLVKLGEDIQTIVIDQVHRLMDVDVKKVKVKVKPFDSASKRQKAGRPRVV